MRSNQPSIKEQTNDVYYTDRMATMQRIVLVS